MKPSSVPAVLHSEELPSAMGSSPCVPGATVLPLQSSGFSRSEVLPLLEGEACYTGVGCRSPLLEIEATTVYFAILENPCHGQSIPPLN